MAAPAYWQLCKPGIEKTSQVWKDRAIFGEFSHLIRLTGELDCGRGIKAPTHDLLRQVIEAEAVRGEEAPTTTTE